MTIPTTTHKYCSYNYNITTTTTTASATTTITIALQYNYNYNSSTVHYTALHHTTQPLHCTTL